MFRSRVIMSMEFTCMGGSDPNVRFKFLNNTYDYIKSLTDGLHIGGRRRG